MTSTGHRRRVARRSEHVREPPLGAALSVSPATDGEPPGPPLAPALVHVRGNHAGPRGDDRAGRDEHGADFGVHGGVGVPKAVLVPRDAAVLFVGSSASGVPVRRAVKAAKQPYARIGPQALTMKDAARP